MAWFAQFPPVWRKYKNPHYAHVIMKGKDVFRIRSNRRLTIRQYLRRENERRRKLHQQTSHTLFFASRLFFHLCGDSWTVPTHNRKRGGDEIQTDPRPSQASGCSFENYHPQQERTPIYMSGVPLKVGGGGVGDGRDPDHHGLQSPFLSNK